MRLDEVQGSGALAEPSSYLRLPRLDPAAAEFLWAADYYHGPLSGAVLYEGLLRWFVLCDYSDSADERWRRYLVVELSDDQRRGLERWVDPYRAELLAGPPGYLLKRFYEAYNDYPDPEVQASEVLGWIEVWPNVEA